MERPFASGSALAACDAKPGEGLQVRPPHSLSRFALDIFGLKYALGISMLLKDLWGCKYSRPSKVALLQRVGLLLHALKVSTKDPISLLKCCLAGCCNVVTAFLEMCAAPFDGCLHRCG